MQFGDVALKQAGVPEAKKSHKLNVHTNTPNLLYIRHLARSERCTGSIVFAAIVLFSYKSNYSHHLRNL